MASGLRVRCSFSSSNYLYSNLTTSFGLSRASQHQSQTARPLMSASSPVQVAVVTGANKVRSTSQLFGYHIINIILIL